MTPAIATVPTRPRAIRSRFIADDTPSPYRRPLSMTEFSVVESAEAGERKCPSTNRCKNYDHDSDARHMQNSGEWIPASNKFEPTVHHFNRCLRIGEEQTQKERQLHDRSGSHVTESIGKAKPPPSADSCHAESSNEQAECSE